MTTPHNRPPAWLAGLLAALLPAPAFAQAPATVPPGTPVTIHVTPTPAASPAVSITLGKRIGRVVPHRQGICHTGGGNIDVAQPSTDTVVVTMTGVAVATGSPCGAGVAAMDFDLKQAFEVVFEKSDVRAAKLTLECRVIGLLRTHRGGGTAEASHGCAQVCGDTAVFTNVCVPDQAAACSENLSVNDREGPVSVSVPAGKYTLHQVFHILAAHPRSILPCKAASAEFAPDPALDPLWISYWEPFHGAIKKDFGFQVTLRVAQDTEPPAAAAAPAMLPPGVERLTIEPRKVNNVKN
jgi:hypothetical protein